VRGERYYAVKEQHLGEPGIDPGDGRPLPPFVFQYAIYATDRPELIFRTVTGREAQDLVSNLNERAAVAA